MMKGMFRQSPCRKVAAFLIYTLVALHMKYRRRLWIPLPAILLPSSLLLVVYAEPSNPHVALNANPNTGMATGRTAQQQMSYVDFSNTAIEAVGSSSILIASQTTKEHENGILVVVTVDGTLAGVDRDSGKVLWKQPSSSTPGSTTPTTAATQPSMPPRTASAEADDPTTVSNFPAFKPLLSTTTTAKNAAATTNSEYAAVPCIDGNVFLTGHSQTVSTSIKELVRRAPFLDPKGQFYAGSQQTTAVAIHPFTGQVLQVMGYNERQPSSKRPPWQESSSSDASDDSQSILWIGRIDYSVSVQDARTGRKSVEFSVAEIMPVQDLGSRNGRYDDDDDDDDGSSLTMTASRQRLVSTPSGTLAMVNPAGQVQWVVGESFSTPVAYGISSSGRHVFPVDIVPDVAVPSSGDVEYLIRQLQRQVERIDSDNYGQESDEQTIVGKLEASGQLYALPLGRQRSETTSTSSLPHVATHHAAAVVSSTKIHKTTVPRLAGGFTSQSLSQHTQEEPSLPRRPCHPSSSGFPACLVDHHKHQPPRLEYFYRGQDGLSLSEGLLPPIEQTHAVIHATALSHHHHHGYEFQPPKEDKPSKKDGVGSMVYHPEYGYVKFSSRPKSRYHKVWKIMGSWLPATIALIFVLSFELGRRKRLQELKEEITTQATPTSVAAVTPQNKTDGNTVTTTITSTSITPFASVADIPPKQQQQQHVIQVSDEVLGYGGQGTVVYKGVLDGRDVAVKRMLKAYHASADREIRLLIESDGHPNVVRYFLKEVRGDFVYLALELCDLSLHDLIGVLRESVPALSAHNIAISATKIVLLQIASGVRHLHSLRIAHRDLKPANILLAVNKGKKKCGGNLETFLAGSYVAKISDMGLGKQIMGPSSLGGSTMATPSIQGNNGKSAVSSIGVGPGTVGWQAPEVMATRWVASDASAKSGESRTAPVIQDASPLDFTSANPRTSRAVDIFSLGCIFYSTLVPGFHPFGEWYEREANIVHNRPSIEALERRSPEAFDLVKTMLNRDPKLRPTAKHVCEHPFFWPSSKKLAFLCDFSDRLESDASVPTSTPLICSLSIERGAVDVVGTSWDAKLDGSLISNMQRFRTYDPSSVRDLLRLIRNKHHHFDELPEDFRASQVANQDALLEYFESKFPHLLMHCWNCCRTVLHADDPLKEKYDISMAPTEPTKLLPSVGAAPRSLEFLGDTSEIGPALGGLKGSVTKAGGEADELVTSVVEFAVDSCEYEKVDLEPSAGEVAKSLQGSSTEVPSVSPPDLVDDVIAWVGSTAAKELNCRGWNRSDAEWARRIDPVYRKKDQNLRRAIEDPKYRTRLCNHWDVSMGTFCTMRKRNKCIFAHGPAELRIKEGKKNRWGKLVDKNGDNKNPCHSGGEDTYGAARSIESTRKEEGKWNTSAGGKGGKSKKPGGSKGRSAPHAPS
jgi:serine/threonine protein kinase